MFGNRKVLTALIASLLALSGVLSSSPEVLSPKSPPDKDEMADLYVSDSLICNDATCYAKVFEATNEWEQIKPGQQLPGGLDIRINLETGLKEAKLGTDDTNRKNFEETVQSSTIASPGEKALVQVEPKDSHELSDYEFSNDFGIIRALTKKAESEPSSLSAYDIDTLETKFDDLMEFAHDYKHGYKIVSHEFSLLRNISFDERLPISLRELSTRMITSCLRNNPPVVEYTNQAYPDFHSEVFQAIRSLLHNYSLPSVNVLVKRYLSVLEELLSSSHNFTQDDMKILKQVYMMSDRQIRIKVLELITKLFASASEDTTALNKRDLELVVPDIQEWVNELQTLIQDKDIDELHKRKFFNSLYNIKEAYKSGVKIGSSFLNWLETEAESRKNDLEDDLKARDLEQDSFDKRLIDSRHLIFGNPMAHRIKRFNDEL